VVVISGNAEMNPATSCLFQKYAELMERGPTDKGNETFLPTVFLLHQPCLPMLSQPKVLTANEDYLMVTAVNICVNKTGYTKKYARG
jgi:hypothetical protein